MKAQTKRPLKWAKWGVLGLVIANEIRGAVFVGVVGVPILKAMWGL